MKPIMGETVQRTFMTRQIPALNLFFPLLLTVALLWFSGCGGGDSQPGAKSNGNTENKGNGDDHVLPQAKPVMLWIKAVETNNPELLKQAFSSEYQKKFAEMGWDEVLKIYKDVLTRQYKEVRVVDFSFQFEGDQEKGVVRISHSKESRKADKKPPGMDVIFEDGEWRINER